MANPTTNLNITLPVPAAESSRGTWGTTINDAIQSLDTGIADRGVPSGGTDNQMLTKDGTTDYETQWTSAVIASTITASGDTTLSGDVTIADGTNDLDVASHDGTNGLKLGGVLVTATAAQLNILTGETDLATQSELDARVSAATTAAQGVGTGNSPTFVAVTANVTGNLTGNVTGDVTGNITGDEIVVNNTGSDVGVKVNSTSSTHIMQLQDNGTDVFVVNDGGKVAGGVSGNAASLLHLRGPSGADTDIRLEGTPGSADGVVANIDAYHGANNVGKIRFKRGADAADGEIEFFTANDTLNSAAMHIDQNSKVGINTVTPSTPLDVNGTATATAFAGPLTGDVTGDVTGNADTATALETARTIGGVSFNGTANINLPGVNTAGTQNTSGNAATVTTNANLTGDITSTGNATAIAAGVIIDADVKSDAAIAMSKTALVDGTGLTLSTNTLSVDAAQTQITSVGTIGTGTWQGTAVAQAYIADQAINEAKLQASNAPTNGYVLTARSGNTGGMTWEAAGTGFDSAGTGVAMAIALG